MSDRPFTEQLAVLAEPIWRAQHEHPFVRGIGDGTLDHARFRHYIRQDYVFLIDYARLLALGCARAPGLEEMERFAELVRSVVHDEMDLHRSLALEWGISRDELEHEPPAPTTRAYTDFLLRTATLGDHAELVAALLPCMWGYHEVGLRLAAGPRPADERYARWIASYADDGFGRLASWCRELTDTVAAGLPEPGRDRMRNAFLVSARFELAFWEMAWSLEPAPGATSDG